MTCLQQPLDAAHDYEPAEPQAAGIAIVDPERLPEVAGPCSYGGCGCPAFVRDYYGDCAACTHPANAHY